MIFSKNLLLLLLVICVSIACVTETKKVEKAENYGDNTKSNPPISKKTTETSEGAKETTSEDSFNGQELVFKGENSEIKIETDLKTSLENQEHPNLWFEYKDEKENIVKKEISNEIIEIIDNKWKSHLIYLYHKNITDNKDAIYESTFGNSMEGETSSKKLEKLEIELPKKRKNFTKDEIRTLIVLQEKLASERFEELAKRFNQ